MSLTSVPTGTGCGFWSHPVLSGQAARAAGLCACIAAFLMCVASGSASPAYSAEAQSAYELLDSIGMNTHLGADDTGPGGNSYGDTEKIIRELSYIHVRHARDSLFIGSNVGKFDLVHQRLGVRFDLVYDYYAKDGGTLKLNAAIANIQDHADLIEAVEGPNEPDWFGIRYDRAKGAAAVIAATRALHAAIRNNPKLSAIPVYCPALSYPAGGGMADGLGNLASVCNASNSHAYVENITLGTFRPYEYLEHWTKLPLAFAPGLPRIITEGGWPTNPADAQGVDEPTQAKNLLFYELDAFSQGIRRIYFYELSDDHPDPGNTKTESHFGVFRSDGSPKPAAAMLSHLHEILAGGSPRPGSLAYAVDGLPETAHHLLLRRGDGTFVLALWNEAKLWDRSEHRALPQTVTTAVLTFEAPVHGVEVVDPLSGAVTMPAVEADRKVTVSIPDHAIFVLIKAAAPGRKDGAQD
jgi:hypothetical protein